MTSTHPPVTPPPSHDDPFIQYRAEGQSWTYVRYDPAKEPVYLPAMRNLITHDLSEPYSIYVYRYFLLTWPDLSFLCIADSGHLLGVIICKLEPHVPPGVAHAPPDRAPSPAMRGYIAMLATHASHRKRGIASGLVRLAVQGMVDKGAEEVVLETEVSNEASLRLYRRLGFVRTKRLWRYYLNGNEAFRLELRVAGVDGGDEAERESEDESEEVLEWG